MGSKKYGFGGSHESIDHIKGNTGEGWHAVIFHDKESALAATNEATQKLVITGLMITIVLAITALLLAKKLSNPIVRLAAKTKIIGNGNFDIKVEVDSGDELGSLAESFNNMADNLKRTMASKDELSHEIEQRIQAEKSLRDSELKFRSLSDASFEGIILSDKGKLLGVNNTISILFGYSIDELMSMSVTDLVAPEKREEVQEKIMSGYEQPYEVQCLKKDGSVFTVEVHGKMFPYKGRHIRVTAVRDISERKQAEEEIKALRGIIPICMFCKQIRDDDGFWQQVEQYVSEHSAAQFSHSICDICMGKHYPEEYESISTKSE